MRVDEIHEKDSVKEVEHVIVTRRIQCHYFKTIVKGLKLPSTNRIINGSSVIQEYRHVQFQALDKMQVKNLGSSRP